MTVVLCCNLSTDMRQINPWLWEALFPPRLTIADLWCCRNCVFGHFASTNMFTHLYTSWDNSPSLIKKVWAGEYVQLVSKATEAGSLACCGCRQSENTGELIQRLLSVHHSTPSLQTCILLPNNLISPSITRFCFQQVISEAAWERARRHGDHSSPWMQPRVVKKRRAKRLLWSGICFLPSPRFNGAVMDGWGGGGGDGVVVGQLSKPTFELGCIPVISKGKTQWSILWNLSSDWCILFKTIH